MTAESPRRQLNPAFVYAQQHADSIRQVISKRLSPCIRRIVDSADIQQSVQRALLGQSVPSRPLSDQELRRLVFAIVTRKINQKVRDEHLSRWQPLPRDRALMAATPDPASVADYHELLEVARTAAGDDWPLVEARLEGCKFRELAEQFEANPDALRMRHQRAMDRIADALGGHWG